MTDDTKEEKKKTKRTRMIPRRGQADERACPAISPDPDKPWEYPIGFGSQFEYWHARVSIAPHEATLRSLTRNGVGISDVVNGARTYAEVNELHVYEILTRERDSAGNVIPNSNRKKDETSRQLSLDEMTS